MTNGLTIDIITLVSAAAALCAIIFGFANWRRAGQKDTKNEGAQNGVIMTELGYIKKGIDDIQRKQEVQDRRHTELAIEVGRIGESAKAAHRRLDGLVK